MNTPREPNVRVVAARVGSHARDPRHQNSAKTARWVTLTLGPKPIAPCVAITHPIDTIAGPVASIPVRQVATALSEVNDAKR